MVEQQYVVVYIKMAKFCKVLLRATIRAIFAWTTVTVCTLLEWHVIFVVSVPEVSENSNQTVVWMAITFMYAYRWSPWYSF